MMDPSPPDADPHNAARGATLASQARLGRKLRTAGLVALGNVIGLVLCAVLSIGFELPKPSLIGFALAALGYNEWQGRKLLRAADARAPRRLAFNQLLLLLVVIVYCGYGAYSAWTGPSPLDEVLRADPELGEALSGGDLGDVSELSDWGRRAALVVYGAVAVGSVVVQSLMALYYLSLRKTLAALAGAPASSPPRA